MNRFRAAALVALAGIGGCAVAPDPWTDIQISGLVQDRFSRLAADEEPVTGSIDLYEAMARALKYNLDHRVEHLGAAIKLRELDLAHYSLLPNIVANSGYAARDNDNASNSVNVLTGVQSLATSTSQERRLSTSDAVFSWNVLDFGLSYVRARQAADKALIAEELRRRAINRLIEDVRTAYWRAVSSDQLIRRLRQLETRIRRAQVNARHASADRQTSPIVAATNERELIDIKRIVHELQRDLSVARTQLAALMNLKPGTPFVLSPGRHSSVSSVAMPVADMIETALRNRSELREVWYQQRIAKHELDAALLELIPSLGVYAGSNYDSNDFLYNSNWVSWGAKASWNLLRVIQYPAKRSVVEATAQQLAERELALMMAIATQVHVSRIRVLQAAKEVRIAQEYVETQRRLTGLVRAEASANRVGEQTLIREEMTLLVGEARRSIAHAGLQSAIASVYASMGLDPYSQVLDLNTNVQGVAAYLRNLWIERGALGGGRRP